MVDWVGAPPLLVKPRRQPRIVPGNAVSQIGPRSAPKPGDGTGNHVASNEEPFSDDLVRNRQKELQDLIVTSEDAETILSTVRELDGAITISTAMHRLGKVTTTAETTNDPRFGILLDKFKERLPFFGSRQISNSLHGLGSIFYRGGGAWVNMLTIQTQRRIREFEPQHVSNTLWACARMQLQEPTMLRVLITRAIEDIGRYCPLDVSIVTWACATLKLREVEWLRAVVRTRLEFADFSPQNMSNFVWGLATLGLKNDNMVLAVGREAAKKIQDFSPQELSNFCWALATMNLCDNLMLRAVSDEVERRGTEVHSWDPQSLSNMMWAYATLTIKDDILFLHLINASVARIADHDPQNLANSTWATAMVSFRRSDWLEKVAMATVQQITGCQTLHLAQLAFAFARFNFRGEKYNLLEAFLNETLKRVEEFAPQSLFDVHDMLKFFGVLPSKPTPIERCLKDYYEDLLACVKAFASQFTHSKPTAAQVAAYRQSIEQREIVTLGMHHTKAFLQHFGVFCPDDDPFIAHGRKQILDWRAEEAVKDPTSRSIFHRAQCAWNLGMQGNGGGALADGVFESGDPIGDGPDKYGLVVCRLRHPREGDAEIQALCAALKTSILRSGKPPKGLLLNLHLSDVPCVSCLGATLQFAHMHPGILRVSFDRGRQLNEDSVPIPKPPPPPSKKGNPFPYAPIPEFNHKTSTGDGMGENSNAVDRSMLRRDGPDCREVTSFYGGARTPVRINGAASGGNEAVPHKFVNGSQGANQQTYYFSVQPEFYKSGEYENCGSHKMQ